MNRLSLALAVSLATISLAFAQSHKDQGGTIIPAVASALMNPTSALAMTAATTAYSSGQLIATSATAGSVVVPSFLIPQGNLTGFIPRVRLSINDATSTAWGAAGIQIDLWSSAPTFTNGDRAAFLPATGTASHLGSYSCTMSAEYGDGVYSECAPAVGTSPAYALPGSTIYWTAQTTGASGVTGASKTMTLTAEVLQ